jgi:hypothetical protein
VRSAVADAPSRPLDARTEESLSKSLRALKAEESGYISYPEAARLFSSTDDPNGWDPEWDEDVRLTIASFAAEDRHRSVPKNEPDHRRIRLHGDDLSHANARRMALPNGAACV